MDFLTRSHTVHLTLEPCRVRGHDARTVENAHTSLDFPKTLLTAAVDQEP